MTFGTNVSANFSRSSLVQGNGTSYLNDNYFYGAVRSLPYLTPDEYEGTLESANAMLQKYGNSAMPYLLLDKEEQTVLVKMNLNY